MMLLPAPKTSGATSETRAARFREQRWLLDAVIGIAGIDWDMARTAAYTAPCPPEAAADFAMATQRIKKFDDMHREFAAAAKRREAKAFAFEQSGRSVAARESFFIAAQLWACARWPLFDVTDRYRTTEASLSACYDGYVRHAPRPTERIEIPFGDGFLPGYLHLPRTPVAGESFPVAVYVPGMDNNKEQMVSLYGERMIERGVAVLAIDGPGQAECIARGIFATATNHAQAGLAIGDWLATHPALDASKIVLRGVSFGSYFALQMAAALGSRAKGVVSAYVAHEPGLSTLFEAASPTFKVRFMLMSGYDDEAAFDRFVQEFDILPWGPRLACPVMIQAGENDELSPLEHSEALFDSINSPKSLVVYEGHKHVLRGAGAVAMGENPDTLFADWFLDRLNDKPMNSERVFVSMSGQTQRTPA